MTRNRATARHQHWSMAARTERAMIESAEAAIQAETPDTPIEFDEAHRSALRKFEPTETSIVGLVREQRRI